MELNLLMQQYRERSQFYAWEVARELSIPKNKMLLTILRIMATAPHMLPPLKILPIFVQAWPGIPVKHQRNYCEKKLRYLAKQGLVHCIKREGQTPFYKISDFGQFVIECLPKEGSATPEPEILTRDIKDIGEKEMQSFHWEGRRRRYNWESLEPYILVLLHKGCNRTTIAEELKIPVMTLNRYIRLAQLEQK